MRDEDATKDYWYMPRKGTFKRSDFLALVAKDLIRSTPIASTITKAGYDKAFSLLEQTGYGEELQPLKMANWQKVREVLRSMTKKYNKEVDHTNFEMYVALARMLWRQSIMDR